TSQSTTGPTLTPSSPLLPHSLPMVARPPIPRLEVAGGFSAYSPLSSQDGEVVGDLQSSLPLPAERKRLDP
ncbi:MAG: hypothetical protein KC561_06610, partial [Myxococcales bacterium]|nr:hypothetical protein [Myxococcales bacterium]